jgi:hypothetical protein
MVILLFLTLIVAIVGAIAAGSRAYEKLKLESAQPETVQEFKSLEADQPKLQPDLDSERSQLVKSERGTTNDPTIVVSPMMPQSEIEISLATSLTISDAIKPPEVEIHLSNEPTHEDHHAESVVEEIHQLDHLDEILNQLAHRATDSNHLVRLATTIELEELARQRQAIDRVIGLLNQLTQDANLEVQAQAGASLAVLSSELHLDKKGG